MEAMRTKSCAELLGANITEGSNRSDGLSATDADGVPEDARAVRVSFSQMSANTATCPQTALEPYDSELYRTVSRIIQRYLG